MDRCEGEANGARAHLYICQLSSTAPRITFGASGAPPTAVRTFSSTTAPSATDCSRTLPLLPSFSAPFNPLLTTRVSLALAAPTTPPTLVLLLLLLPLDACELPRRWSPAFAFDLERDSQDVPFAEASGLVEEVDGALLCPVMSR